MNCWQGCIAEIIGGNQGAIGERVTCVRIGKFGESIDNQIKLIIPPGNTIWILDKPVLCTIQYLDGREYTLPLPIKNDKNMRPYIPPEIREEVEKENLDNPIVSTMKLYKVKSLIIK